MIRGSYRSMRIHGRFLVRGLALFVSAVLSTVIGQANAHAQNRSAAYTPSTLKAPYTLVFSVRVVTPGQLLRMNTPLSAEQTGTLTVSTNGTKVLYLEKFDKWSHVVICDTSTDTLYFYDNRFHNAVIEPDVKNGLALMLLLPMPGVGYDFYPMFQSFQYSGSGPSQATMAIIGAVTGGTAHYIQGMLYQGALVDIKRGTNSPLVSSCKIMVQGRPNLVQEIWKFSAYQMVGSVPIARTIDHILNAAADKGIWPPNAMEQDGEVRYKLQSVSTSALPDPSFALESYVPPHLEISDARKKP